MNSEAAVLYGNESRSLVESLDISALSVVCSLPGRSRVYEEDSSRLPNDRSGLSDFNSDPLCPNASFRGPSKGFLSPLSNGFLSPRSYGFLSPSNDL
jgi:hypothetical protein